MFAPPPKGRGRLRGLLGVPLGLCAGLAACGDEPPPTPLWIPLARGFEPRPLVEQLAEWERASAAPTGTRLEAQPPGMALRRELAAAEWTPGAEPGFFTLPLPAGALRACGVPPRLLGRGREFAHAEPGREPAVGELQVLGRRLLLRLAPDTLRAPQTTLVVARPDARPDAPLQELPLRSGDWRPGESPGLFWIEVPGGMEVAGQGAREAHGAVRLFAELVRVDEDRPLQPYEYHADGERLSLHWPEGAPPAVTLLARLENGRVMDGSWQLRIGNLCANGIPVWSGTREELVLDVPPESQLAFRFVHAARPGSGEPVHARVRLDGELLFERSFAPGTWSAPAHAVVALPSAGRAGARLAFEVEGAPGLGAFFTPVIGPREFGTPAHRPYPARADLVLFLVDTLRADSLALYGGDPALAPNLNRCAQQALAFARARSNAAWTLPSIASILTGLHPGQHGATDEDLTLSATHVTLTERLERAGYRTGAITDGSFFSPVFGLDQGFEWFVQHEVEDWDLDRSVAAAREFLAQDDGRPVFLVLHTYRVHQPYRVGPEEDRRAYDECMAEAEAESGSDPSTPHDRLARLARHEGELRALYQEGVRDLDRGFGELVAALEERDFFAHGTLAVTSDHGEALGENLDFFHGGHLWETKLLVPLFLRAPGLAPRVVPHLAGPVDLAPTFAALAGIPADPAWVGSSLLTLAHERPAFAFQLSVRNRQVAALSGTHKVILTPEPERLVRGACEEAFDLAQDPREERNLAASADWPTELTQRLAPAILGTLEALGTAERAGVSAELRAELDALGYGGDER